METTIVYWVLYGENGKSNGNYYNGLYCDHWGMIGMPTVILSFGSV